MFWIASLSLCIICMFPTLLVECEIGNARVICIFCDLYGTGLGARISPKLLKLSDEYLNTLGHGDVSWENTQPNKSSTKNISCSSISKCASYKSKRQTDWTPVTVFPIYRLPYYNPMTDHVCLYTYVCGMPVRKPSVF